MLSSDVQVNFINFFCSICFIAIVLEGNSTFLFPLTLD